MVLTRPKFNIGMFAISFVVLFLLYGGVAHADSLFFGNYAVANWTTALTNTATLTNLDGSVDTSLAPLSILLTGGDNLSGTPGETLFSITVPSTTTLAFDWTYTSYDAFNTYADPGGYEINGTQFQLSPIDCSVCQGIPETGETSVNLNAGDTFAFYVDTVDNFFGPATLQVSTAPVPEPSSLALMSVGLLGLAVLVWRGKRSRTVSQQA